MDSKIVIQMLELSHKKFKDSNKNSSTSMNMLETNKNIQSLSQEIEDIR